MVHPSRLACVARRKEEITTEAGPSSQARVDCHAGGLLRLCVQDVLQPGQCPVRCFVDAQCTGSRWMPTPHSSHGASVRWRWRLPVSMRGYIQSKPAGWLYRLLATAWVCSLASEVKRGCSNFFAAGAVWTVVEGRWNLSSLWKQRRRMGMWWIVGACGVVWRGGRSVRKLDWLGCW